MYFLRSQVIKQDFYCHIILKNINSNYNFIKQEFYSPCDHHTFTSMFRFSKIINFLFFLLQISSSEVGVVPDVTKPSHVSTKAELAIDREARLMRYREKRKNRRFEKTIRYASRKAYAETRPRIKGRFAKRTDSTEPEAEQFDRVFDFMIDPGYSVVPTF